MFRNRNLLPRTCIERLAPQMNRRLLELNENLIQLWKLEQPKP
jgi:hypothetical protein